MTTGLTYDTYVSQMALMSVVHPDDANFNASLSSMITYAENRIYRDLDLLISRSSDTSHKLVHGSRKMTVLPEVILVSEQLNIITPVDINDPEVGTRNPCIPVTRDYLDTVYGDFSTSARGVPKYYAVVSDTLYYFGPVPDADYTVEIIGTMRPLSLAAGNPVTFISEFLPDLMIMASMVYVSAYQRNFGAVVNDPQMAMTYEAQYQALLAGAMMEEQRKKYQGPGWASRAPTPIASPSRG